jgi:hypothetical protein
MTAFLWLWLVTQAIGIGLVWLFTIGLGRRAPALDEDAPRVVVVVAVKGHDPEFDEFLVRLFEQDYPAFRVIFAVEAATDPAVPAIEKCRAIAPDRVTLVVAEQRADEGQKTTNLRAAVATLTPDDEIVVFADADIWPEPDWLARMVAPLAGGEADVVSGFAWLIVKDNRLSSYALTAMAASIATIIKTGGFADVAAEARRWFMLVRIYMPVSYWVTVAAMSFSALGWLASIGGTLALQRDAMLVLILALALNVLRACGRARLVKRLWGAPGVAENANYLRLDPLVSPLAVFLNAACGWSALLMRRTTWAGITYEITGPQEVEVLARKR